MQSYLVKQNFIPALLLNLTELVPADPVQQAVEAEVRFLFGLGGMGGGIGLEKTWTSSVHLPLDRNWQGRACFDCCPRPVGKDLPVEVPSYRVAQDSRAELPAELDQAAFLFAHSVVVEHPIRASFRGVYPFAKRRISRKLCARPLALAIIPVGMIAE